jgi:hypothetical protein
LSFSTYSHDLNGSIATSPPPEPVEYVCLRYGGLHLGTKYFRTRRKPRVVILGILSTIERSQLQLSLHVSNQNVVGIIQPLAFLSHLFKILQSLQANAASSTSPWSLLPLQQIVTYNRNLQGYNRLRGTPGLLISALVRGEKSSLVCARRLYCMPGE